MTLRGRQLHIKVLVKGQEGFREHEMKLGQTGQPPLLVKLPRETLAPGQGYRSCKDFSLNSKDEVRCL